MVREETKALTCRLKGEDERSLQSQRHVTGRKGQREGGSWVLFRDLITWGIAWACQHVSHVGH